MRSLLVSVALVAVTTLPVAACGEDDTDNSGARAPAPAEKAGAAPTPMSCLEEVVVNAERRDKNLWRGGLGQGGNMVLVDKLASKAEAREAVAAADLVVSEAVGRYFVHGPALDADDGSTTAVAACLQGR